MPVWLSKLRRYLKYQHMIFVCVGMLNAAFGYTVYAVAVLAGLHYAAALFIATVSGVVFNFYSTGRLVFANRSGSKFLRFVAAYVALYLINLGFLSILIQFGISKLIGQIICLVIMTPITFITLNKFVFSRREHQ